MRIFEFYSPMKVIAGTQAASALPREMDRLGCVSPFLVTDPGIVSAGLEKQLRKDLKLEQVILAGIFSDVPPDSSVQTVNRIIGEYQQEGADCIIALGGGSVIDTAKAAAAAIGNNTDDLLSLSGVDNLSKPSIPVLVVPTTSGTGSEATCACVIASQEYGEKMLITADWVVPAAAFLDPRYTQSLPSKITAMTGMDAFTHAVEAFTCGQKNPVSDPLAREAVRLISENIVPAIENPNDLTCRLNMQIASLLAGMAFSNAMVGGVHSLGHAAGAVCHLPHGLAMNIFLPVLMAYNMDAVGNLYGELLLDFGGPKEYLDTEPEKRGTVFREKVLGLQQVLQEKTGLVNSLQEAGVQKDQFQAIAEKAINDGSVIMNPVPIEMGNALSLLENAW